MSRATKAQMFDEMTEFRKELEKKYESVKEKTIKISERAEKERELDVAYFNNAMLSLDKRLSNLENIINAFFDSHSDILTKNLKNAIEKESKEEEQQ